MRSFLNYYVNYPHYKFGVNMNQIKVDRYKRQANIAQRVLGTISGDYSC